jgi:hypothetical protein
MNENEKKLEDRVPVNLSATVFEGLQHEKSRQHILGIIKDYTDHVDFMAKVRKYAADELDSRMFVSIKFWVITATAAALSGIVSILISKWIHW